MNSKTVQYVSAIARALGHVCAPSELDEMRALSLRELSLLMRANGVHYNGAKQDLELPCLEGWEETTKLDWSGKPQFMLRHRTGSGRLLVEATDGEVILTFFAGPAFAGGEGRVILSTRMWFEERLGLDVVLYNVNLKLINEKPERLELLGRIDDQLNYELSSALERDKGAFRGDVAKRILEILDARLVYTRRS